MKSVRLDMDTRFLGCGRGFAMATEGVRWVDGVQDGSAESNRWMRRDDPSSIQRCDEEPPANRGRGSCVHAVHLSVCAGVCVCVCDRALFPSSI